MCTLITFRLLSVSSFSQPVHAAVERFVGQGRPVDFLGVDIDADAVLLRLGIQRHAAFPPPVERYALARPEALEDVLFAEPGDGLVFTDSDGAQQLLPPRQGVLLRLDRETDIFDNGLHGSAKCFRG